MADPGRPRILTSASYRRGLKELSERDRDLAAILTRLGPPPMWLREPGFATLVHIILEQQVSLASAKAAFDRLRAELSTVTPHGFLKLNDRKLKQIGFSRQKTGYCRELAVELAAGRLDLGSLQRMSDRDAAGELTKLKGVGPWTAPIYLLMALRRPDVWPSNDLALATAVREVKRLRAHPEPPKLESVGRRWKPWRAVAARLLWHHYLAKNL
jgi:DNA-3-methyladenine glycosylase II